MVALDNKPVKSKIINLYYINTVRSDTSTSEMLAMGIKLMQAIVEIEKLGYRVNLNVLGTFTHLNQRHEQVDMVSVRVKSDKQMLNPYEIIFPIANPSMFRILMFHWQNRQLNGEYHDGRGYAMSQTINQSELTQFVKNVTGEKTAVVLELDKLIQTNATADDILNKILNPS